jgi:drug/metabolite transporter (DMT)-like permease
LAVAIGSVSVSSTLALFAAREAQPLVISFYRLLFATLMLAGPAILVARSESFRISLKDMAMLGGVGLLLASHFATWLTSLAYTSAASSVVIVTTEALWVPLGAHFLLRERVGSGVWIGILVAFSGAVLLVAGDIGETRFGPDALLGDFLAFAAALAASGYFLAGRRLRQRMNLLTYASIVYAWATFFLFIFVLANGQFLGPFSPDIVVFLFLFALIPMILGHTIINYVLRWIRSHVVSTAILVEPVVSAILALIYFQQNPSLLVWLGGSVILIGVALATFATEGSPDAEAGVPG